MPALAHRLRNWQPQPDPIAEQLKQLELQKLQAEMEKLQADAEFSRARAKLAASQADKVDLDYVEQETGTQRDREIMLLGEHIQNVYQLINNTGNSNGTADSGNS